jgi:hypothetical protein
MQLLTTFSGRMFVMASQLPIMPGVAFFRNLTRRMADWCNTKPVDVYGCETWILALMAAQRLRAFENKNDERNGWT